MAKWKKRFSHLVDALCIRIHVKVENNHGSAFQTKTNVCEVKVERKLGSGTNFRIEVTLHFGYGCAMHRVLY